MLFLRSLVCACLVAIPLFAGILPPAEYDPAVPTVKGLYGFEIGEKILDASQVVSYAQALDEASNRVVAISDGETYNHRPLIYLCVSDPENLTRLDAIAATSRAVREAKADFPAGHPVTVALYAAVHGDEISSVEASLALAYYLAASREASVAELLKNEVIVIDPLQNPDGRSRFLAYQEWMRMSRPVADQNAAEHSEFWPGGRGNGNFFDMNRDWVVMSQPETRTRLRRYFERLPQVIVDLHEMGGDSTYYFPPPAPPVNKNVPEALLRMIEAFGQANAKAFDERGFAYYTGEVFDEFYPGYGSSWPLFNGTVGMTYEQASASGLLYRKATGEVMTFEDTIARHFTAALTTCRTAAAHRQDLLGAYRDIFRTATAGSKKGDLNSYVLPPQRNLDRFLSLLRDHGIAIRRLENSLTPKSASPIFGAAPRGGPVLPAGSAVISVAQPSRSLIRTIFDLQPVMDERFVAAELERRRERRESEIYDVTAWSLPILYNVTGYAVTDSVPTGSDWRSRDFGSIEGETSATPYAWVIDSSQDQAVAVVAGLLREGIHVEISEKALVVSGRSCARGSYVVLGAGNPPDAGERLRRLVTSERVTAIAAASGLTEADSIDLGSRHLSPLRDPRIAVLTDAPVSSTSYGALRWLLEHEYQVDFTPIKARDVSDLDLTPYRTIVIPHASADQLGRVLGKSGIDRLKRWVSSGGTLVAVKGAARMLFGDDYKLGGGKILNLFKKDSAEPAPEKKKAGEEKEAEECRDCEPPADIPGCFYTVAFDTLDWLTAGYANTAPAFVSGNLVIDWPEREDRCVARFDRSPKISGFTLPIDDRRLEGKAYLARVEQEDGQVIVFADEPYFRGTLRGLDRLFLNAVFNAASYLRGLDY